MVLINGNRRYKASTNYVDGKVLLTDLDTEVQFYLPVAIAYSYKALRHHSRPVSGKTTFSITMNLS